MRSSAYQVEDVTAFVACTIPDTYNVDAPTGGLQGEVLDAAGKTLARSHTIRGDLPRQQVSWVASDITELTGQVVSLRFTLQNGSLYSYWLADQR